MKSKSIKQGARKAAEAGQDKRPLCFERRDLSPLCTARVKAAEMLAESWNRDGLRYAVTHGLEHHPTDIGRDLDIALLEKDMRRACHGFEEAREFLGTAWFLVRRMPHPLYNCSMIYWSPTDRFRALTADLICSDQFWTTCWLVPLCSTKEILQDVERLGPFCVSPFGTFMKAVIRPAMSGDFRRFADDCHGKRFVSGKAKARCARRLGRRDAENLVADLERGRNVLLANWRSRRRRVFLRNLFLHPARSVWWGILRLIVKLRVRLHTPLRIAVVGPDGVGKSSAIQEACRLLRYSYLDITTRHWRPGVLPRLRSFLGGGREHQPADSSPPRRKPGPFRLVRLFYYWLDYWIGHFARDCKPPVNEFRVVLGDRCALDMSVDPVRYGLKSAFGTRLLYAGAPGPHFIILLRDSPERILCRKAELTAAELEEQFRRWDRHIATGRVHRVVQAGDSVEETGRRLAETILDCAAERYEPAKVPPWRQVARERGFLVLRSKGRDRLAVPVKPRCAVHTVLALHGYSMSSGTFARLAGKLFSGLFLRLRGHLRLTPGSRLGHWDWKAWLGKTAEALGHEDLAAAFYFPPQLGRRKAGVWLMTEEGEAVAFAKIAWDDRSREELWREAEGLRCVARLSPDSFRAPSLLSTGEMDGRACNVYSLLPPGSGNAPKKWGRSYEAAWRELLMKTARKSRLERLSWWPSVPAYGEVWRRLADLIARQEPDSGFEFYAAHGDLAPWNARREGKALWLFDWEQFDRQAPILLDPLHFLLQVEVSLRKRSLRRAALRMLNSLAKWSRPKPARANMGLVLAYWRCRGDVILPSYLGTMARMLLEA